MWGGGIENGEGPTVVVYIEGTGRVFDTGNAAEQPLKNNKTTEGNEQPKQDNTRALSLLLVRVLLSFGGVDP